MKRLFKLFRNNEGQDLAEYALLLSLIALVVVVAVTALGLNINTIFQNIGAALTS